MSLPRSSLETVGGAGNRGGAGAEHFDTALIPDFVVGWT